MTDHPQPRRRPARRQLRHPRAPRPGGLRRPLAERAGAADRRLGARARPRTDLLPDQPRGRVRRVPAPAARARRRGAGQRRRLDPLQPRDRRRARVAGLPAVEVHLSDVESATTGAAISVFDGLVLAKISGKGAGRLPRGARRCSPASSASSALMRGRGDRLDGLARPSASSTGCWSPTSINVRYLTGFTGTNGACVCGAGHAPLPHRLPLHRARRGRGRGLGDGHGQPTTGWAGSPSGSSGRVGFEDDHMSVRTLERLRGETRRRGRAGRRPAARSRSCAGSRTRTSWRRSRPPRSSPTRSGAGASSAASPGAASATSPAPPKRGSASSAASPPSRRSSPPAPTARCRTPSPASARSARGELVVFDMGAKLDGYCSDGTRTFATGEPGERGARGLRDRAARPRRRRSTRSRPGSAARRVDAVAREVIAAAGHGERFGHGLGHGVGLEVHEGPRLSPRSEDVLAAGEVVTVEPGIYLPGELGRADRGPGRRHRGRLPQPQRPAQGAAARRLRRPPSRSSLQLSRGRLSRCRERCASIAIGARTPTAPAARASRWPRSATRRAASACSTWSCGCAATALPASRSSPWRWPRSAPEVGWWWIAAAGRRLRRLRRRRPLHATSAHPALWVPAAWGSLPLLLAGAVIATGGADEPGADVVRAAGGHPRRSLRAARAWSLGTAYILALLPAQHRRPRPRRGRRHTASS